MDIKAIFKSNNMKRTTIMAVPNEGYEFVNWTEGNNVISTESVTEIELTKDMDIVANFKETTYTVKLTSNPEEGGNVTGGGIF